MRFLKKVMTSLPDETVQPRRNNAIDLIRGLSIFAVILLHMNLQIPFAKSVYGQSLPHAITNILFWSGYYGVIVFFVVSGFLITNSSIKRWGDIQNVKCQQFYLLRFARIVPCLIALLIVLSFFDLLHMNGFVIKVTTLRHAILAALTFHINWLEAKFGYLPGSWDVLWSLSVEETFYLFFPLLCVFVKNKYIFMSILIAFIILGPFARVAFSHNDIWSDHSYLSCADGIVWGCLAALYVNKAKLNMKHAKSILNLGLILFSLVFLFRSLTYKMGLTALGLNVTILEIGMALVLISLSLRNITKQHFSHLTGIFRWFGCNSYEIYLTHMLAIIFMAQIFHSLQLSYNYALLWYITTFVIIGIFGHLVAHYYSIPLNKLIRIKSAYE